MKENELQTAEDLFEMLPYELKTYIFSFFSQKELNMVACVNQNLKQFSDTRMDQLKNKYADNIFYTVGKPIRYTSNNSAQRVLLPSASYIRRKVIPLKEIYESFMEKNISDVKLFDTQQEAFQYSVSLKDSRYLEAPAKKEQEFFQPAVFKVIYLSEINTLQVKRKSDTIYGRCRDTQFVNTDYFETKRIMVLPLEGILKITKTFQSCLLNYGKLNLKELFKTDWARNSPDNTHITNTDNDDINRIETTSTKSTCSIV